MPTLSESQKKFWKQVLLIVWFIFLGVVMTMNHGVVGWGMGALWGITLTLVMLRMRDVIKF